jgi:hypothetical protein
MTRLTAIPLLVLAILAAGCAGLPAGTDYPVREAPDRNQEGGGAMDIRPTLKDWLSALEPLEPVPVADAAPKS